MSAIPGFWAVIPAGGSGTRLWPLSRSGEPKFLHDLTASGRSLLQGTVDRLAPLVEDRCLVVTGAAHRDLVLAQLPELDPGLVIAEPSPRESMPAVGLAAALLEVREPDAVLGSFAADHLITRTDRFADCVRLAEQVARDGWLVTIGIEPTYPATGFGYLQLGAELTGHRGVRAVRRFVEKPSAEVASGYLGEGDHLWNAGMFVVRPTVLLDLLAENHPALASGLRSIARGERELDVVWPELTRIALDHAVAEPAADLGRVAVVPSAFDWDDLGDFASLADRLPVPDSGPQVLGERGLVEALDATGLVVPASGRTIAVIGLDDVVVVDTADAVLVTTRARAQDVRRIVEELKAQGRSELT